MNSLPGGTVTGPKLSRGETGDLSDAATSQCRCGSSIGAPLSHTTPFFTAIVSPATPITRLMKSLVRSGGKTNTTTSPRWTGSRWKTYWPSGRPGTSSPKIESGIRRPKMILLTRIWSPMSSVGSIDPDGILYAWMKNVRMKIASRSAMTIASPYSRATDFCAGASSALSRACCGRALGMVRAGSATIALLPDLEQGQESLLRNLDASDLLHPLLPFLLLLEQLAFSRDIAAVTLGGDVFAQRLDGFTRDDLGADRGLNRDFEHLARNQFAHLFAQRPAPFVGLVAMHDNRKRVHHLAVDPYIQFNQRPGPEVQKLVIQRCVAAAHRFEPIVKVEDNLGQRQLVVQDDALLAEEPQVALDAAAVLAQLHHGAQILFGHVDRREDEGLLDCLDGVLIGQMRGIVHRRQLARNGAHLVGDRRRGDDQVDTEFALEPLLRDLHVQQSEEAGAEAEAQRLGGLGLADQTRVVEAQLFDRVAQRTVLIRLGRIESREDHRLQFLEARQRRDRGIVRVGNGVANAHVRDGFDIRHDEPDLARAERFCAPLVRREMPQAHHLAQLVGAHQANFHAIAQLAAENAHQPDHAFVHVIPTVEDERADGVLVGRFRRRDSRDDRFEHLVDADALLSAGQNRVRSIKPDDFLDLLLGTFDVGAGQIDFVDHGNNFETVIEREINVGERLRLDPLARVDHQQRALTCSQAARHFVREIHMPGRVDQVEYIAFAVLGRIVEPHRARLDRNPALALEVHRIQKLILRLAHRERAGALEDPIGERGLAVIDMRDDRKITNRGGVGHFNSDGRVAA